MLLRLSATFALSKVVLFTDTIIMLLFVPDSVIACYLISFAILLFHVPKLMYMTWYNEIIRH